MEENLKQLLLKDLCARLPYGVKVKHEAQDFPSTLLWVDPERLSAGRKADKIGVGSDWGNIEFIKPYLRPLSSMTEEEARELGALHDIKEYIWSVKVTNTYIDYTVDDGFNSTEIRTIWYDELVSSVECLDWLNSKHFDYRGLIPKGLAIEKPKEMYKKGE